MRRRLPQPKSNLILPESPEMLMRIREFELHQQQGPHASIHASNLNLNYNNNQNYWEMAPTDVQNIIKEKLSYTKGTKLVFDRAVQSIIQDMAAGTLSGRTRRLVTLVGRRAKVMRELPQLCESVDPCTFKMLQNSQTVLKNLFLNTRAYQHYLDNTVYKNYRSIANVHPITRQVHYYLPQQPRHPEVQALINAIQAVQAVMPLPVAPVVPQAIPFYENLARTSFSPGVEFNAGPLCLKIAKPLFGSKGHKPLQVQFVVNFEHFRTTKPDFLSFNAKGQIYLYKAMDINLEGNFNFTPKTGLREYKAQINTPVYVYSFAQPFNDMAFGVSKKQGEPANIFGETGFKCYHFNNSSPWVLKATCAPIQGEIESVPLTRSALAVTGRATGKAKTGEPQSADYLNKNLHRYSLPWRLSQGEGNDQSSSGRPEKICLQGQEPSNVSLQTIQNKPNNVYLYIIPVFVLGVALSNLFNNKFVKKKIALINFRIKLLWKTKFG